MGMALRRAAFLTVLAASALVACGDGDEGPGGATGTGTGSATHHGGEQSAAFGRDDATTQVRLTMRDFAFERLPDTVRGPRVFFEARNVGPSEHELVVTDDGGDALAAVHSVPKGRTRTLAAELRPGRYRARCLIKEGDRTHAELGMETRFSVE